MMESGIEILDDSSCNNTVEAKPTPETPAVEEDSKPAAAETEKEAAESDEAPLAKVPKLEHEHSDDVKPVTASAATSEQAVAESETNVKTLSLKQEVSEFLFQQPKEEPIATKSEQSSALASCVEKSATSSSSTVSEASAAPSCDSGVGVGGGSLSSSVEIKQEMLDSLSSTTTSNPNPTNPKGGRRPLFDSMRFYSIGASEEAIHMLTEHGAVQENALSRQVTHIIAGMAVDLYNEEATQAADVFDKVVVCDDWVLACVKYCSMLPLNAFRIHRKRLFKDMHICLSKLSTKDRHTLHFLITHYGGSCTLKLDKTVTHLVTGSSDGRKYERASKLASCEIVAPDWITDSIKAHQALSPKNFSPNRLVDSVESGYLHAIDSVLTGASLAGLSTKPGPCISSSQFSSGNRSKHAVQKDSLGRIIKTGSLAAKSTSLLTKKKLSKGASKAGGFFGPSGGGLLSLQKPYSSSSSAADILSPPLSSLPPIGPNFFGHDPEQHIPAECCLIGCRFLIVDSEHIASSDEIDMWKKVIDNYHGSVGNAHNSKITHIICTSQSCKAFKRGIHDAKRIVTPYWLNEVIKRKEHFPPCEAIHFPVNFPPTRSVLQGKIMSACGFTVEEREKLKIMFYTLGVKYSPAFSQSCFALICKSLNNEKVKRAQEWSIPIYNVEYLSDLLLRGKIAVENASSPVYQNFDKSDPFKLDVTTYKELYRLPKNVYEEDPDPDALCVALFRFMSAWVKPMKMNAGELRKKSQYWEYLLLKQKQTSDDPSCSCLKRVRQTSSEGGASKEYVLYPPSRPQQHMPKVVFTGVDAGELKKLKEKLYSLGGETASTMGECTHIVAPTVLRTVKFLVGVCTVTHFVTPQWIEDSFEKKWWQKEPLYVPTSEKLERVLGFRLIGSLKRAKEKKLLSGYRIYMTPGVEPNFSTMQLIVEAAGGRMLRAEPEVYDSNSQFKPIIVTCEKDLPMCSKYIGRNIGVYSPELILTGVLTQDLELERFQLQIPSSTNTGGCSTVVSSTAPPPAIVSSSVSTLSTEELSSVFAVPKVALQTSAATNLISTSEQQIVF